MRKAKLSKYVAVVTAIGMIAVSPMAALADTVESVKIEGKGTETADGVKNTKAEDGVSMTDKGDTALSGTVTVNGNVSVSNENSSGDLFGETNGISIESSKGGNGTVTVTGDVTADASKNDDAAIFATGVSTGTNATVNIGGNVTASTNGKTGYEGYGLYDVAMGVHSSAAKTNDPEYKADIHVVGNIDAISGNGKAVGVDIGYNSTGSTTIDGNINASGKYAEGILIQSSETTCEEDKNIDISVGGNLDAEGTESGTGIFVAQNNKDLNITVEGDITGSTYGIYVKENTGKANIVSGGTISSEDGAAIVVVKLTDDQKAPEVTAWKIESGAEQLVSAKVPDESQKGGGLKEDTEYAKTVQSAINYIIKADATENGSTSSNGKIVLKGTSGRVTVGDKTYDTAHQDETITINVETAKGYKSTVQNNGAGTLTKNADGTYTLTIPAGGGVDLKAVLEKIEEQNKGNSTSNSGRHNSSSSSSSSSSSVSGSSAVIYAPGSGISGDTNWAYDNNGWKLKKPDGNYASSEWRQVNWNGTTNWYHFNNNGYADGGWFTDSDGQRYFLYNAHDGQFGYMFTGWKQIDGQWYFFNTANTATASLGSLFTNGTTPDGYQVNANGIWVH